MLRTMVTILHSEYASQFVNQTNDLTAWVEEIVAASFAFQQVSYTLLSSFISPHLSMSLRPAQQPLPKLLQLDFLLRRFFSRSHDIRLVPPRSTRSINGDHPRRRKSSTDHLREHQFQNRSSPTRRQSQRLSIRRNRISRRTGFYSIDGGCVERLGRRRRDYQYTGFFGITSRCR